MLSLSLPLLFLTCCAGTIFFQEDFSGDWQSRWVQSKAKPDFGKFKVSAGKFYADAEASLGLQTSEDARFYALSAKFPAFSNQDKSLVVQFEVKHEQNIDCGGGYLKLLPSTTDQSAFAGESPYSIMFGPDICGYDKKVHLIFNYKGQNHLWKKKPVCESDQMTHLYTLVLHSDNTYEMHIDGTKKESGKLEEDWDLLKPKEIDDPTDKKPSDWVDEAEINDPDDKKPDDWDKEPETIPDPEAKQPEDWDVEEDGQWEPPMIPNPKFKGVWKAKRIPNPKYKGVWKAKRIANPEYEPDKNLYLYTDLGVVGFDLWQVKSGTIFDNIIITDSLEEAKALASKTFDVHKAQEKKMKDDQEAEEKKKSETAKPQSESEDAGEVGGDEDAGEPHDEP
jgi:calreticulin